MSDEKLYSLKDFHIGAMLASDFIINKMMKDVKEDLTQEQKVEAKSNAIKNLAEYSAIIECILKHKDEKGSVFKIGEVYANLLMENENG